MRSGSAGLKRLAKLYGMVEHLHAMQVKAATGGLAEVERAAAQLREAEYKEVSQARSGLAQGSRVGSMAVEKTAVGAAALRVQIARIRGERRQAHEAAVTAHRGSRVELRQIDGVVDRVEQRERVEMDRREQGASDDRFLSRREWMRAQELRDQG